MTILKEYRIDNKINQEKMASKLQCSLPAYRNYENGLRIIPYNVLIAFLRLRGKEQDLEIATALEEFYESNNITR